MRNYTTSNIPILQQTFIIFGYTTDILMGNLNCSQYPPDSETELRDLPLDHKNRAQSPIKIQQIQGEDFEPLLTTVRRPESFIHRILNQSKQKKKKTEKQMGEFIQGLLQKGKQSDKYLNQKRRDKLVAETRRAAPKQLSFDFDKFILKQQQFLDKRNQSLERSRQTLYASRTMEETHHPKINDNSRRIAIQVSSRNFENKKLVLLKDPKTKIKKNKKIIDQNNSTVDKLKKKVYPVSNKFNSSKKSNEYCLQNKLKTEFEKCCNQLGISGNLNYLHFTSVLTMMNFSNGNMKQRAMLLQGWNLLAGDRIQIDRKLVFSFNTAFSDLSNQYKSAETDSPNRLKRDLDYTYLTQSNQKPQEMHQDRLNYSISCQIRQQYRSFYYNKLSEKKGHSNQRISSQTSKNTDQREQRLNSKARQQVKQQLVNNYRSRIVKKAEEMHILQPMLINRELSGYQVNKLSNMIHQQQLQQIQIQKQLKQISECSFQPKQSKNLNSGRCLNEYFSTSKEKQGTPDKYNSLQSTFAKMKLKTQPILQIEVSIGNKIEKIFIFEGDDTEQLAQKFLQKNHLSLAFKDKLIEMIADGLDKI